MSELPVHKYRRDKLEGAIKGIDKLSPEIKANPEVSEAIKEVRKQINELKGKVQEENYDELKRPTEASLSDLNKSIKKAENEISSKAAEGLNMLKIDSIEKEINSFPVEFKNAPYVKNKIDTIFGTFLELKNTPSLYDAKKKGITDLVHELRGLKHIVEAQFNELNSLEKNFKSLSPEISSDSRIKPLIADIFGEINYLRGKVGSDEYNKDKINDKLKAYKSVEPFVNSLSERNRTFEKFQKQAREFVGSKGPKNAEILYDFFSLDKEDVGDAEKLAASLAQMMLEGDGLTLTQILKFADTYKDKDEKTVSEETIKKWVKEIDENTSGKVDGTKIEGSMPVGMQEAIRGQLKGPNTLKMMQVASERYQAELNDYLAGVDNEKPLSELGFTDDDWFLNWKDDAGEGLEKLNFTNQEAKLVFLEAYTTLLAGVIKDPGQLDAKEWSLGWWWLAIIASGLLGSGLFTYRWFFGPEKTAKLFERSTKPISSFVKNLWVNNNLYKSTNDTLSDVYRSYIDGNIKLIYARMALKKGGKVRVGVDEYGPLSYEEGLARISAIKAAVGSSEKEGRLTKVGLSSVNDQRYAGTIGLTRYVQNLARAPGGVFGMVLRPNMWRYESSWGRKIPGGIGRFAILASAYSTSGSSLLLLPFSYRTVLGSTLRLPNTRLRGYQIESDGKKRMPLTDQNAADKGIEYIAKMLDRSPELARLTCSDAERKSAIELLNKYVQDVPNTNPTGNYTEKEALDLIGDALDGRGPKLNRAELRIFTIQAIYLLKGESGLVQRNVIDNFIDRINKYRLVYTASHDELDKLYERILHHEKDLYGPEELKLLVADIESFYQGENIAVTDMSGRNITRREEVFLPATTRVTITAEMAEAIVVDAAAWLKRQTSTTTKEMFARYINTQLAGRGAPASYSIYNRFCVEWESDALRRGGLYELVEKIDNGDITNEEELTHAIDVLTEDPKYASTPPERKSEFRALLIARLATHINNVTAAIQSNNCFESAKSHTEAQKALTEIISKPAHRAVVISIIPGSYEADYGKPELKESVVQNYVRTRWESWIDTIITDIKTNCDSNPLSDATWISIQDTIQKCDDGRRIQLLQYFQGKLETLAAQNNVDAVTRENRKKAIKILREQVLPLLGLDVKDNLVAFLDKQESEMKDMDLQREVEQLKNDITDDPLEDEVESRFTDTMKKCGDRSIQGLELIKHFERELKVVASSQDPQRQMLREEALQLLELHIMPRLTRTPKAELGIYITTQRNSINPNTLTPTTTTINAPSIIPPPPPRESAPEATSAAPAVPAESGDTPKEDIVKLKSDIERSPIKRGIKARILRVLDDKAVTDTKKDELVNKYIGSLKAIIRDEANTLGDRRSAIRALQETMVTGRLQTVENTQLTKYCERAEVAIKALESTLERARVNSEALAQKIESLFKDETTLDGRRTALRSLMSDERISPFMKNDIDTMLPEGGVVTEATITGCVHRILLGQQGIALDVGEGIAQAHRRLIADHDVLAKINGSLRSAQVAEVTENVTENVTIKH
ncbi:MAG: hypothetical protein WC753_03980 [Candidatus Gracilibacteria bacterium]